MLIKNVLKMSCSPWQHQEEKAHLLYTSQNCFSVEWSLTFQMEDGFETTENYEQTKSMCSCLIYQLTYGLTLYEGVLGFFAPYLFSY